MDEMTEGGKRPFPPTTRRSKQWQLGLGLLISVAFLWLALRNMRLGDVWQNLRGANYA